MRKRFGCETITNDDVKLFVEYEWSSRTDLEECHGYHAIVTTYVDIKRVEVVIDEMGIDITSKLTPNQMISIENQLSIY